MSAPSSTFDAKYRVSIAGEILVKSFEQIEAAVRPVRISSPWPVRTTVL
jgi:hypothetical protein